MATQRFKLYELLGKAGEASAWSQGTFTCVGCRRRFSSQKFETTIGSVCVSCVEQNLKIRSKTQSLTSWSVSRIIAALADDGPMDDRLPTLWKYHETIKLLNAQAPSRLSDFYTNLVKNLGYIQDHPLAQTVRQAAYQACVTIGKPLVPTLLNLCQPTPWQFYANVIMVVGTIAPEHGEVQALIHTASQDANPEISDRAQAVLHNMAVESGGKQDVLHSLLDVLPKELRNLVHVGMQEAGLGQPQVKKKPKPVPLKKSKTATASKKASYLPHQKQIEDILNAKYSVDALKKIYDTHMQNLVDADLHPDADLPSTKIKKQTLAWLIARVYTDQELFIQFHERLPYVVKEIVKQLVWEGGEADATLLEKVHQIEMVRQDVSYRYGAVSLDVQDAYTIFLIRREYRHDYYHGSKSNPYHYHFSLPDQIRNMFKQHLPHPPQYDMLPLKTIQETAFQYVDGDLILQQLPLFYSYIEQGHLSFSQSTGKLLKNSVKLMAKYCHIQEFYDEKNKDLGLMRTKMLIEFCHTVTMKDGITSDPATLRALFDKFFTTTGYQSLSLSGLLWHLQGVHNLSSYYYGESPELPVRKTLHALLKAMPAQAWLNPEDLVQYCLYRDLPLEIAPKSSATRYLSYRRDVPKNDRYYYDTKVSVSAGNYKDTVMLPFFKAAMFLFASFGIVDIAYEEPLNDTVQQAKKLYLSPFDGLRYVRLTPLGAYVAGQTQWYEAAIEEEHAVITLDENRLLLTIEGQDRLKTLVIEKMAEKIGASCYRVNYQSFLRECQTTQDIEKTIDLFHAHICADPPEVWQEFLQDVLSKINPLQPNQSIAIYKLADNKELRSLIAQDEVLKKHVMKAENFHIAVESKNLLKVKKRLEEFGYLIDNL